MNVLFGQHNFTRLLHTDSCCRYCSPPIQVATCFFFTRYQSKIDTQSTELKKPDHSNPDHLRRTYDYLHYSSTVTAHYLQVNKINPLTPPGHLSRLHMILKPFMLRRIKKDVENELSDKIEIMVYCPLTSRQKLLYSGNPNILSHTHIIKYTL